MEARNVSGQTATKESTKTLLLEKGLEIMFEKGYNNTGIMEVLHATGVPKGSFYHYFESKEDFGLQIINYFQNSYDAKLNATIGNLSLSPVARLKAYFEQGMEMASGNACRKGCLIGNLSTEMSDQSEVFRKRLLEIQVKTTERFANLLLEAQQKGEICQSYNCQDLAEFLQSAWSGATMRVKTSKNIEPMKAVMRVLFEKILKP